ncbi:hypothetical protein PIB30_101578 [Stylosanthes scabra]|uniref:Uncharacterized protein n=1 Tax=Stylosanthes scabra TaxID=79078 RepID=A0ABU6WVQ8_9FABA|nr:hypothetical protein [Stylosanthes scabra]
MDDFRLFLQEQRVYQKQQATQIANLTEILAGSTDDISFHEDSLELEVADDDEEEFHKMLEEISMKDDVGFEGSKGIIEHGDGKQEDMPRVTYPSIPPSNDVVISLPSDEPIFHDKICVIFDGFFNLKPHNCL